MALEGWLDLGPLDALPDGRPTLVKALSHRLACVRRGDAVDVLDDGCPHEGYLLSQGAVRDGVLTCAWHNWKFDLATGGCTFGGEPVRRYPARVDAGRVWVDVRRDVAGERARIAASLGEAFQKDAMARALREALRLGAVDGAGAVERAEADPLGPLAAGFEALARDGAERGEYGFEHGLAALADLASWVERGWVDAAEAFVVGSHGVCEPALHRGARPKATPIATDPGGLAVARALSDERRDEAEGRVRALVAAAGVDAAVQALLPFAATHVLDYGHGVIFLAKARELARRFPPAAEELMAAVTVMLGWATADTALPPFRATVAALESVAVEAARPPGPGVWPGVPGQVGGRAALEQAVLDGERAAVEATLAALAAGVEVGEVLYAIARAAAVRVARFDDAWEARLDASVGVLDVTHGLTQAESALRLARLATREDAWRMAVLCAGFVGKLRAGDRAGAAPVLDIPGEGGGADLDRLAAHVEARDLEGALEAAACLSHGAHAEALARLAPFAALDAATRPIFVAHTVKMTEALWRLERADPEARGAYLEAALRFMVPRRRELRARRTAFIARKFLRDGKPPEGLY